MATDTAATSTTGLARAAPPFRFQPTPRFAAPSRVLHGQILPSLLDETLLELELSLAHFDTSLGFGGTVASAARALNGEFLFELPASGLVDNCQRLAALRIPTADGTITVFACLESDSGGIRIAFPDERTEPLQRFADSFVGLLERF